MCHTHTVCHAVFQLVPLILFGTALLRTSTLLSTHAQCLSYNIHLIFNWKAFTNTNINNNCLQMLNQSEGISKTHLRLCHPQQLQTTPAPLHQPKPVPLHQPQPVPLHQPQLGPQQQSGLLGISPGKGARPRSSSSWAAEALPLQTAPPDSVPALFQRGVPELSGGSQLGTGPWGCLDPC